MIHKATRDLSIYAPDPPRPTIECQAGHPMHEKIRVGVDLRGATRVPDYPKIREEFGTSFHMDVYDRDRYIDYPAYCTGKDEVSFSLTSHGVWEGFETLAVLEILSRGDRSRLVVDFGGHVGWYSLIAASLGYQVLAFEADAENVRTLRANAEMNGFGSRISVVHTWVDDRFPDLPPGDEIEFMKCDLEGLDVQAVRACRGYFQAGKIRHALIEISPVFAGAPPVEPTMRDVRNYLDLTRTIASWGYDVFDIPSKGYARMLGYEISPLQTMREEDRGFDAMLSYLAAVQQTNLLFVAR